MKVKFGASIGILSFAVNLFGADEPQPGVLAFGAATYAVAENSASGFAVIDVVRAGGSAGLVSVQFYTANRTAVAGQDYSGVIGTLVFAAGQTNKTFTIPILDDALIEGNEIVTLILTNATGGATLAGGTNSATVDMVIVDNDFSPGTLSFSAASYRQNERDHLAMITMRRTNGTTGIVSARYYTSNGTATAGQDYLSINGVLTLGDGQTERTVAVAILEDTFIEGDETVLLVLTNATGGATFPNGAASATATLTIGDSDAPSLSPPVRRGTNTIEFSLEVLPSLRYTVQYCESLSPNTWLTLTNFQGAAVPFTAIITEPCGNIGRFYRVLCEP